MTYPKAIMAITELEALGYSRYQLRNMVHIRGQDFAFRLPGGKKWYIDTEKFEKFRERKLIRR